MIKNGEPHIEAIAAAAKAREEAGALGWRSPDYDYELLAATEMDEAGDDEPTEEELQWAEDRILRQAEYGERLDKCLVEYDTYAEAAAVRSEAWKGVGNQKESLEKDKRSVTARRVQYNVLIPNYKGSRAGFRDALERRDKERARMQRARAEGNAQGYQPRRELLIKYEEELSAWKENLRKDYDEISERRSEHLETRIKAADTRRKYNAMLAAYKRIDSELWKTKAAFDSCMELSGAPEIAIAVTGVSYLSDMTELGSGDLWSPLSKVPRTLGGREYKKSLFTHPKKGGVIGFVEYKLDGKFSSFHAIVGMHEPYPKNTETACLDSKRMGYRVLVDGVTKAEGISLYEYRTVNINIEGAELLRLEVNDGGDEHWCDWLSWADAYVD